VTKRSETREEINRPSRLSRTYKMPQRGALGGFFATKGRSPIALA